MKPLPLVAAAVLVSVLSGCNGGHRDPVTDGPLSSGSPPTHAEACAAARVGQALTFGLEQFTNHGRSGPSFRHGHSKIGVRVIAEAGQAMAEPVSLRLGEVVDEPED